MERHIVKLLRKNSYTIIHNNNKGGKMSKEIARTPLLIKTLAFILLILGLILIYLTATSTELTLNHKLIGYIVGLTLTIIPGLILIYNITE